jgi:GTP-binding protein EngB required for normal cell division
MAPESSRNHGRDSVLWEQFANLVQADVGKQWLAERATALRDARDRAVVRVAVVGKFNAGKSTLVNNLIGESLLTEGATETTATVAEIRHDETRHFGWVDDPVGAFGGGEDIAISEAEFKARTTLKHDSPKVGIAWAKWPNLPTGVALADTPGIGSLEEMHTRVTYGYLAIADAIVYLIDSRANVHQGDVEFLRDVLLPATRTKLIFAVTHIDLIVDSARSGVIGAVAKALQAAGIESPKVVGIDGKGATAARLKGESFRGTGIDTLQAMLQADFYSRVGPMRDEQARKAFAGVVGEAIGLVEAKAAAAQLDDGELATKVSELRKTRDKLREQLGAAKAKAAREGSNLRSVVESGVARTVAGVAQGARAYVEQVERQGGGDVAGVSVKARADLTRALDSWQRAELKPRLDKALADLSASVESALAEIRVEAPELQIPEPESGGAVWIDVAVEVGLFVLLDLVLPGGPIWALGARLVGKKFVDKVSEPIKDFLKKVVVGIAGGVVKGQLSKMVADNINGMADDIGRQVMEQVQAVLSQAVAGVDAEVSRRVDAVIELMRASQNEADRSAQERRQQRERLLRLATELRGMQARLGGQAR